MKVILSKEEFEKYKRSLARNEAVEAEFGDIQPSPVRPNQFALLGLVAQHKQASDIEVIVEP
jgi:hypothetical protein